MEQPAFRDQNGPQPCYLQVVGKNLLILISILISSLIGPSFVYLSQCFKVALSLVVFILCFSLCLAGFTFFMLAL